MTRSVFPSASIRGTAYHCSWKSTVFHSFFFRARSAALIQLQEGKPSVKRPIEKRGKPSRSRLWCQTVARSPPV